MSEYVILGIIIIVQGILCLWALTSKQKRISALESAVDFWMKQAEFYNKSSTEINQYYTGKLYETNNLCESMRKNVTKINNDIRTLSSRLGNARSRLAEEQARNSELSTKLVNLQNDFDQSKEELTRKALHIAALQADLNYEEE